MLAFWIEFAQIWVNLADYSPTQQQRLECLKRAEVCVCRAKQVREKIEQATRYQKINQRGEHSVATIAS